MFVLALFWNIVLLLLGFAALIKGADFFVDGSSALARTFRVPSVIIGLTIVAFGTSAPELAVSTSAAVSGANEIALSNVTGSNIFNLLMVLGVCAVIRPIPIERGILKRDFPFSIAVAVAILLAVSLPMLTGGVTLPVPMSQNVGEISRWLGIVLLAVFVAYVVLLVFFARRNKTDESDEPPVPVWKSLLLIAVGIACIIVGGQLVVNNAVDIAAFFGMSQTLIGLTVVALGTSLPELVTSIVASRKGENGLAVGNVVGSNLFNMLLILGASAAIHPITVNFASVIDLGIMIAVSVITLLFCLTKHISRVEGAVMVLLYAATMVFAVVR